MARNRRPAPPVATVKPLTPEETLRVKLDRCGHLLAEYARNKPWLDELKNLKDEIRGHYVNSPAADPLRVEGNLYIIDLTRCEEKREVTDKQLAFAALEKAAGMEKLIEGLTLPLKLLDAWLSEAQQRPFVKKDRTGARDISAVLKAPAAAQKAA